MDQIGDKAKGSTLKKETANMERLINDAGNADLWTRSMAAPKEQYYARCLSNSECPKCSVLCG